MDQDEETELGPELKKKDLCFTGARVDGFTSENVIAQGSEQEKKWSEPSNVFLHNWLLASYLLYRQESGISFLFYLCKNEQELLLSDFGFRSKIQFQNRLLLLGLIIIVDTNKPLADQI